MSCNCNKPKCDGKCGISPSVLQINNPGDCTLFHRVEVPASMGDSKTNPPKNGDYRNVLLYYVADGTSWLFSSDGIPQKLVNGFTNYEDAQYLPSINNHVLLGNMTSSDLGLQNALVAGANIQINDNTISATDTVYTLPIASADTLGGVKIGANLSINGSGVLSADAQPAILYSGTGQNTNGAMTQKATTDSLSAESDSRIAGDANLQSQINGLASGSPLVASSTAEMTDTTRVYVNTTDGHWYYYDGAQWQDGGTYQASEDSDTVMIANSTAKGLGLTFTHKGMIPLRRLYTGYLNSQTGEVVLDYSRVYTSVYVEDDVQRIIPDSGYAVAVYMYDKADDSYVGRMLQDYTLSNSASPSPSMKWFTDLDLNFVRGKYPNYGIKLVMRKDDYSSISDITSWIRHFKTYTKNELEEYTFNQNNEYEFQIDDIWERGEILNEGTISNTNSRLYTTYYIPNYANGVIGLSSRLFKVHAYKKSDGSYVGKLNEDGRFATTGTTATPSRVNFDSLRRQYPEYEFKLTVFISGSTSQTTILRSDQIKFLAARKMQETITSRKHYGYEVKEAANIANHDMTYVGDFIYLFDAPSSDYDGKFNILNSDLTINRTKYTNFNYLLRDGETRSYLRMKSVDYNPTNEILMVANGQLPLLPNDSYIFMFYDAKGWKNSNIYNYTFESCGEYKQIDVSELGDRVYAFWKTYEETDEIYVTINNLEKIYLLELGKGTNDFGHGVYEAATATRYNGTWRIVECWTQQNANIPDINAHGGQVYKGELYLASNNEFECVVHKAILGDDGSLKFEKIDLNEYGNKKLKYSYIDGMLIKDGKMVVDPLKINEVYHTGSNKVLLTVDI